MNAIHRPSPDTSRSTWRDTATPRPPAGTSRPRTRRPALAAVAAAWSAGCAALGLWWLLVPGAYPLDRGGTGSSSGLVEIVPAQMASWAFLVLGVAGIGLAVLLGQAGARAAGGRALLAAGAGYAVVFGILVPDVQLLAVLGYLIALTGPGVLVVLLAVGARRHPRNLLVLMVIGLGVLAGLLAGQIGEPTVQMLRGIRDGFGRIGIRPLVLAGLLAGGVLFAVLTLTAARRGFLAPSTPASRERLDRWGRVATWVAAASPMPYALIRMTWLTPWPQGVPGGPDSLGGGVRVFGILLGLAAVGGGLLTLGLVFRWGEVFPAWLPGLRGRAVPVPAAVIPGTAVAAVLCASAISIVTMSTADGAGWLVAAIPAPLWGPALGLATYAYYRRRTPDSPL